MRRQESEEPELGNGERGGSGRAPGLHRPHVLSSSAACSVRTPRSGRWFKISSTSARSVLGAGRVGEPHVDASELERVWTEIVGNPSEDRPESLGGGQLDASLLLVSRSQATTMPKGPGPVVMCSWR